MDLELSIDDAIPSVKGVREAVARLRFGEEIGVGNICLELIKTKGPVIIHGLHTVLTAV